MVVELLRLEYIFFLFHSHHVAATVRTTHVPVKSPSLSSPSSLSILTLRVHSCPHIRETCRNRAAHPRMDVLYLTNAEVERFNGCGFCKWAHTDPPPPPHEAGYKNRGWPGCCRPPSSSEYDLIEIENWPAVAIVHDVPIPRHLEAILKSLPLPSKMAQPLSPGGRSPPSKASTPSTIRKSTGGTTPSKPSVLSTKAMNTPSHSRGRSPHATSPVANVPRTPSSTAISSSVPSSSSMDTIRRKSGTSGTSERRLEGVQSAHSSPGRKSIEIENPVSPRRVSSVRRPTLTPATTSVSVSKIVAGDSRAPRAPTVQDNSSKPRPSISTSPSRQQTPRIPEPVTFLAPRPSKTTDDCGASSSSGSSDGVGSLSDSTITSDGGFTDYLSDESEAELQRQAEAKAIVMAQNLQEENEFKMARQQLAHIDLRPPKSWNPTNSPKKLTI
ncbi:hypothetical protein JR316_0004915 [Psilocybe cubensis]|uniref:Uncharacterized protein n=2 Tax=Psilocybe cubensis TaxID=181762 RepID=A0ACB8H487_PSICU|nr:hypothetical protein JR316_0004915 [Psilocybe cubensis]KAH9482815.1 hypothetical protein JR316_0004915 [Psilocybe cubensis]